MSEVKTFRAASMQEALAIVRHELGSDAVILRTRHVTQKRLLPFLKGREEVEITAGLGINVRPQAVTRSAAHSGSSSDNHSLSAGTPTLPAAPLPNPVRNEPATPLSKAAQIAAELERRAADKRRLQDSLRSLSAARQPQKIEPPQSGGIDLLQREKESVPAPPVLNRTARPTDSVTGHNSAAEEPQPESPPNQATALRAAAQSKREPDTTLELSTKLDALQKMVESLTRSTQFRGADEIPGELFEIYTQLIDADIEDDLARELIFGLRQNCTAAQIHDPAACRAFLTGLIESEMRCADAIRTTPGRRKVVALVGPTGVGKTTTIAKLAANFRLRDGIRMGLVTVDTYRIAAVEQLRTYAEIIDLPMKVVTSPQEMRRALSELSGLDLVLIDTAGRSPRDELKIQEVKSMLTEAEVDETHLVMSLTASVRSIKMTCDQFKPVEPTALILTKLDEAAGMGSLLSVNRQVKLPVSYLTTGQDVPEDIEPASAARMARLVLGQDRLFD